MSVQVAADGDNCIFTHSVSKDLKGDDLQAYVDSREDWYKRELLRNMYEGADCYDSSLEDWDKWIADGRVNPEITETITTPAQPAVDAVMGERQVVVESEVEEEVSKTEIVEVDGKFVEQTTTETVTKSVSTPQVTEHQLYNEDGTPQTRVVTEAKDAVLDEDGKEIEAAVEEVTEPVLHSVPTMESFTISEPVEAVAEQSETVITRAESVVEKVAWKDTAE
jgi:hypothetical protein